MLYDLRFRDRGGDMFEVGNRLKEVVVKFRSLEEQEIFEGSLLSALEEDYGSDGLERTRRLGFMRYEVGEGEND